MSKNTWKREEKGEKSYKKCVWETERERERGKREWKIIVVWSGKVSKTNDSIGRIVSHKQWILVASWVGASAAFLVLLNLK